jgi:hypothetical protein
MLDDKNQIVRDLITPTKETGNNQACPKYHPLLASINDR